ncbi:glycosyl transferase [filamentous cyanobacterium CCP5]|nr:glycosyl transferase [filamentous cyanobacterium CCP5]
MATHFVSVIIPVFNNKDYLRICLDGLSKQTYPAESFEIIIVDNSSSQDIEGVVSDYRQVKLLFESQPGSYAARNKGLTFAKGEIIVFIDSDCLPIPQWIEYGVNELKKRSADLAGGQVEFQLSPYKSPAEIYDSVTNMQAKRNIEERQLSTTANLFTHRYVFEAIGIFPQDVKSGGDLRWTKKATESGFKLVFAADAVVYHPARNWKELLKKQFRVGKGQPMIWLQQGQSLRQTALGTIYCLPPPKPKRLLASVDEKQRDKVSASLLGVLMVAWSCNIALALGRLACVFEQQLIKIMKKSSLSN